MGKFFISFLLLSVLALANTQTTSKPVNQPNGNCDKYRINVDDTVNQGLTEMLDPARWNSAVNVIALALPIIAPSLGMAIDQVLSNVHTNITWLPHTQ